MSETEHTPPSTIQQTPQNSAKSLVEKTKMPGYAAKQKECDLGQSHPRKHMEQGFHMKNPQMTFQIL